MEHTNKELWQTTHKWLSTCGFKVNSRYCKEEITTHSDYPALTSVIDFLDSGGMRYKAIQADASYIHEFNYPLLAHIRQPGHEYMYLIPDATIWDKEKEITQNWTGITLYSEGNTRWHNEQNTTYQQNVLKSKIIAIALLSIGFALFIVSAFQFSNFVYNLFGLLSFFGLILSIFLLGTELGFQNQVIKQVCGAVSHGGCEKVLKSNYAKGVVGFTPADASVIYFAAQFVVYLLGCWNPALFDSILILAFSGIIVASWSIYTQAVKLKQYCALCLSIVALLIVQFFDSLYIAPHFNSSTLYIGLGIFIAVFLVLAIVLLPIKQLIKTNSSNKLKLAELKKWKFDADLFINQWQQEQEVDTTIWKNDLVIGNPSAPILITVACNPYCGPCAKAHKQLDTLLHRYANVVKIQIRLLCNTENENDKKTIAVKSILKKAETIKNNSDLQQMLSDWFELMDYEKWKAKWHTNSTINVNERLNQHTKWITDNAIKFTPTIFINCKKMPGRYSLNDIEILMPQLTEIINKEINTNN